MQIFSVAKKVTASAGDENYETIYTVAAARKLTVKKVVFHFPSGTDLYLGVAVTVGAKQICPDEGLIYGNDCVITLSDDTEVPSGSEIKLYYKNEDTSNPHSVVVVVEGEIE